MKRYSKLDSGAIAPQPSTFAPEHSRRSQLPDGGSNPFTHSHGFAAIVLIGAAVAGGLLAWLQL